MGIRYVVMSDLHLGAAYSLLTDADVEGRPRPTTMPPVLRTLADALAALLPRLDGGEPPTLVLLGDVFDLAFCPVRDALTAFQRLAEAFFVRDGVPLFAGVVYVPGNHDHREWQVMRDALYRASVAAHDGPDLPEPTIVTDLFPEQLVPCELVTTVLRGAAGDDGLVVESAYPNLGFRSGGRTVVLHHGHFTESTYRAISAANTWLTGDPDVVDVTSIEQMNGPWIDFLWSTFGDEGMVAGDMYNLYEAMQDPAASHAAVKALARRLLQAAGRTVPIRGSTPISLHGYTVTVQGVVESLLDVTLGRFAQSERSSVDTVLTASGVAGVQWYLSGPVHGQLVQTGAVAARTGAERSDLDGRHSFIFGHTHKPFQDLLITDGYREPVEVWNTGGWVIDHPNLAPAQGASLIFVGDDAHVAALRLFNDPLNGDVGRVRALGCGPLADRENPLLARLHEAVAKDADAWLPFSAACLDGIDQRARWLRYRFFDPSAQPQVPPQSGPRHGRPAYEGSTS